MAKILTGSDTGLFSVFETVFGETPATPVFSPVCANSHNFKLNRDSIEDNCLTPDRKVRGYRQGNESVSSTLAANLRYGDFDPYIEAVLGGAWTTNVVGIGLTQRSATFQQDLNLDVDEYHRWRGNSFNTLAISAQPNSPITIDIGILGRDLDSANLTSEVVGATYNAASGNEMFDSYTGSVTVDSVVQTVVTGIDLSIDNGMESAYTLFNKSTLQPSMKKCRVSASLSFYYTDKTLFEKFLNETTFDVNCTFTGPGGNSLRADLIDCKFTSGGPEITDDGNIQPTQEIMAEDITFTRIPV